MTKAFDYVMAVGGRQERINLAVSPTSLRKWLQVAMLEAYRQGCQDCLEQTVSDNCEIAHDIRRVIFEKKLEDM